MKILYLITKGERGGAQSHLWTLMSLQRFGTPLLALGEDGWLADQARAAGIAVHIIPHWVHPIHPWRDLLAMRELLHLIGKQRPDIIHAHTAKAGMLARVAGFLTATPTVYTVHGWSFTAIPSPLPRMLSLWVERGLSLLDQTVIDVSQFNFKMAEHERVAPRTRHRMIWNGIPDGGRRACFENHSGPVKIVMVARFAPQKDHETLLRALALLRGDWDCTLIGSGPDQTRMESLARYLGIGGCVHFPGDRDDVPELLAQSDLFVLSTNYEGLPISILEAMRAGLPVVATAVGGCAELVIDGLTGLLVRPGDVEHLRDSLEKLITFRPLREQYGQAGRVRFEESFRLDSMVRLTVDAYSQLLPQRMPGLLTKTV